MWMTLYQWPSKAYIDATIEQEAKIAALVESTLAKLNNTPIGTDANASDTKRDLDAIKE